LTRNVFSGVYRDSCGNMDFKWVQDNPAPGATMHLLIFVNTTDNMVFRMSPGV